MADHHTHFSCLLDVGTHENAVRAVDLYNACRTEAVPNMNPPMAFCSRSSLSMTARSSGYAMTSLATLSMSSGSSCTAWRPSA